MTGQDVKGARQAPARRTDTDGGGHGDTAAFVLMVVLLGTVLGAWVGLMVWSLSAADPQPSGPDPLEAEVDSLAAQIDQVATDLTETERASMASEGARDGLEEHLRSLQTALLLMEWRVGDAARDADRLEAGATGASAELDTVLSKLATARSELAVLQDGLADLLARMNSTGGGGGGGGTGPPANATKLPQPHLTHYRTPFLNFSCAICHNLEPTGEAIVYGGSLYFNGSLEAQGFDATVNRTQECVECHGQFPTDVMEPGYKEMTCTACHDDWATAMTASYVNEAAISEKDCLLCHGGPTAFMAVPQSYG